MQNYSFSEKAAWIEPVEAAVAQAKPDDSGYGVIYTVIDEQTLIGAAGYERYNHYAYKILNKYGLDNFSNIEIAFNPQYEKIALHEIRIIRGNERIELLDTNNIRLSKREKDSYRRIYDETQTLLVILDDVMEGDVVEYSFTRIVDSSIPGNCFSDVIYFNWGIPVEKIIARMAVPHGMELSIRDKSGVEPEITDVNGYKNYVWKTSRMNPMRYEQGVPNWVIQDKYVEVSEFKEWCDVVKWAIPKYKDSFEVNEEIRQLADSIKSKTADVSARFIEALRYVRESIRYVSVAYSASGQLPHPASITIDRKYGDCKDKSALLVTLLRELGIVAYPALVNSYTTRGVKDKLPSGNAFDHVIVYAEVNGKKIFADPTMSYSAGNLDNLEMPLYGVALILKEGEDALTDIPQALPAQPNFETHEIFDVKGGYGKPGNLVAKSIYRGSGASEIRAMLASNSMEDIKANYKGYYTNFYEDVEIVGIQFKDDLEKNEVVLFEEYKLSSPWKKGDKNLAHFIFSYAAFRRHFLTPPQEGSRKYPFLIDAAFPHAIKTIEAKLPRSRWSKVKQKKKNKNEFFEYEFEENIRSNVLKSKMELRFLQNLVPAEKFQSYKKDAEKTLENIGDRYMSDHATKWGRFVERYLVILGIVAFIALKIAVVSSQR